MTARRRRWSLACFALLLIADWRLCSWVGGDHASTLFLIVLFLGIVTIGWLFLDPDDVEEWPFDNNQDID